MISDFAADVEFNKLRAGRSNVDLASLMIELAADAYPDLDRVGCLVEIDRLGVACEAVTRPGNDILARLIQISRLLYDIEGFHGNRDAYYEPENSYLNQVLARRLGIPISLGILYMAVAARVGVRMFGVNTPGHFVIGCRSEGKLLLVDPFSGGDVLDRNACRRRIEATVGRRGIVKREHFRPAAPRDIAARVLRNLKAAYALQNEWCAALTVQERLVALLPNSSQERRDLGLIYLRTGQPYQALDVLEGCPCDCGSEPGSVETTLRSARRMAAELN